jgi:aspartate racemase
MDFESRVHRVAQKRIPADGNAGYPPMIVFYYRHAPFVASESGAPAQPLRPDARLLSAAADVGRAADLMVVTSNFLHVFREDIQQAAGCEVLSMIDIAVAEVVRRQWRRVGVAGFGEPFVYMRPLDQAGVAVETITGTLRTRVDSAILRLMEGREDETGRSAARQMITELRARRVDGIILGCTEIPLLLGEAANAPDLLDPLELLAHAAVEQAMA